MARFPLVLAAVLTLASSGALKAQRTWVVDASNAPGTDFTDLAPAVSAAAPGDRIVMRAGAYSGAVIDKALSILGEPGAQLTIMSSAPVPLTVRSIPAGATVTIRGVEVGFLHPLLTSIQVDSCPGSVLLENVRSLTGLTAVLVDDLRLTGCQMQLVRVFDGNVALDRCTLWGALASAGLRVTRSVAQVSRCTIDGGDEFLFAPPIAALELDQSFVEVMGDGSGALRAGSGSAPVGAIAGNGVVIVDPSVPLAPNGGAPPIATTLSSQVRPLPSLAAVGAPPGGTLQVDLFAGTGQGYALFLGLLGSPLVIPGLTGAVWLRGPVLVRAGVVDGTARVVHSVAVPALPELVGWSFAWQALLVDAGTADLSNPSSFVLAP